MERIINFAQIGIAVLLMIFVLLQARGAGLGGVFGGESGVFQTKRGIEKTLFILTIVLAALFLGVALVNILIY